jgi:hypothetical protein
MLKPLVISNTVILCFLEDGLLQTEHVVSVLVNE